MSAIIATIVVAMAGGALVGRCGPALAHRLRRAALGATVWALGPFVVYVNVARFGLSPHAGVAMAIAAAAVACSGVVMWGIGSGPLALAPPTTGAAIVCAIQANTGYLGLPLCAVLLPHAELGQAVLYDATIALPTWVFGSYAVGTVFGGRGVGQAHTRLVRAVACNPPLIAMLAALLVPSAWTPAALIAPSRIVLFALLPIGFAVTGMTVADRSSSAGVPRGSFRRTPVVAATSTRLLVVPVALLAARGAGIDVPAAFVLMGAMPTGINALSVAHATGLDLRLTAACVAWSTPIAVGVVLLGVAVGLL